MRETAQDSVHFIIDAHKKKKEKKKEKGGTFHLKSATILLGGDSSHIVEHVLRSTVYLCDNTCRSVTCQGAVCSQSVLMSPKGIVHPKLKFHPFDTCRRRLWGRFPIHITAAEFHRGKEFRPVKACWRQRENKTTDSAVQFI